MASWYEDDGRDELAIWLGHFSNVADLKTYASGLFRKELGLPKTKYFAITCFEWSFSASGGAKDAIGRLLWSQSYLPQATALARQRNLLNANGAIAVNSYFSDDDFGHDASRAAFLGFIPFDTRAPIAAIQAPAHLNDRKVSVWAAFFRSKAKFQKYFSLDDQTRRTRNRLAIDFEIPSYETDFASWVSSKEMAPTPISDLLSEFPITAAVRKTIAARGAHRGLVEASAVYMAYKVDYDQIGKSADGERRCKGAVRYVGSFDSPSLESQMRILRRRRSQKVTQAAKRAGRRSRMQSK
jgi:hypothetical protein